MPAASSLFVFSLMSDSSSSFIAKSISESTVCEDPAFEVSENNRLIGTATVPNAVPIPYTRGNIWFVVSLVSLAGLARLVPHCVAVPRYVLKNKTFTSPFPTTIYYPSLPVLTQVFHETTERLNLTLTMFLVPMAVCEIFLHLYTAPDLILDRQSL